jgi:antitoxin PrlF
MPTTTITSKGQVTIPKKIREELNLQPGDVLSFEIEKGNKISVRAEKKTANHAFGILYSGARESLSGEDMDRGVVEYFKKKYRTE